MSADLGRQPRQQPMGPPCGVPLPRPSRPAVLLIQRTDIDSLECETSATDEEIAAVTPAAAAAAAAASDHEAATAMVGMHTATLETGTTTTINGAIGTASSATTGAVPVAAVAPAAGAATHVECSGCGKRLTRRAFRAHCLERCTPVSPPTALSVTTSRLDNNEKSPARAQAEKTATGLAETVRKRLSPKFSQATVVCVSAFLRWLAAEDGYSRAVGANGFVRECRSARTITNTAADVCFVLESCAASKVLGEHHSHRLLIHGEVASHVCRMIEGYVGAAGSSHCSFSRKYNLAAATEKFLLYLQSLDTGTKAHLYKPALSAVASCKRLMQLRRNEETSRKFQERALAGPILNVDHYRTLDRELKRRLADIPEEPGLSDARDYAKALATAWFIQM